MFKFLCLLLSVASANCFYINDDSENLSKDKIVGGSYVDIKTTPYLAQILTNGLQVCGGSIISETWIVSAAHCFENVRGKRVSVITGSSYQGDGEEHAVQKVIVHKNYDKDTIDSDIALIQLKRPIEFDETQKPIAITKRLPKTGDKLKIAGFGKIGDDLDYSDDLKAATVTVISHDTCEKKYISDDIEITSNMFCANKRGTDSCQGDSGGPAVINGKLSGIISFGLKCASVHPGVYTQVYNYRDWIAEKTGLDL